MAHVHGAKASHAVTGAAASVAASAGKTTLKKVLRHPVTLIGIGIALGYLVYKTRQGTITEASAE